jgi:hypothetical protein
MKEPIHESKADAIGWVLGNTDNTIFRDPVSDVVVRIDVNNGVVLVLNKSPDNNWYWSSARGLT